MHVDGGEGSRQPQEEEPSLVERALPDGPALVRLEAWIHATSALGAGLAGDGLPLGLRFGAAFVEA